MAKLIKVFFDTNINDYIQLDINAIVPGFNRPYSEIVPLMPNLKPAKLTKDSVILRASFTAHAEIEDENALKEIKEILKINDTSLLKDNKNHSYSFSKICLNGEEATKHYYETMWKLYSLGVIMVGFGSHITEKPAQD